MTQALTEMVEFDCPFRVHPDGSITDEHGVYAPSLFDEELDTPGWTLLDGYSGQQGYSGPVMHNSEFIGGRMEQDIRNTPGVYAVTAAYWSDMEDADADADDNIEGWVVARLDESA